MIEIFKAESHRVIPYVAEKFENIEGLDVRKAVQRLLLQFASDPDNTCLIAVFEDEELQGFIFGWYDTFKESLWLQQAWADKKLKKVYSQECFDKFCDWGSDKGASKVQFQTTRKNAKVWKRAYNVDEYSILLQKEI